MTNYPVLYLDYDGILHAADVRVTRESPLQPRIYLCEKPSDQPLFRYMSLLELLLAPYPDLKIVLATSWVRAFGYAFAIQQLSPILQARVIGAATFPAPTRFDTIAIDAEERGVNSWLALDDDIRGWPVERRNQVVAPTSLVLGLAQPGIAAELARMLEALCTGQPLDVIIRAEKVRPTANRLLDGLGIPDENVVDALEEDARVHEVLRQARAPQDMPVATAESTEAAEQLMAEFRKGSAMAVLARIERKELIGGDEFAARLGVNADAVATEIESGQLFFIAGPSGEPFYPAFFADLQYSHGGLGKVCQVLGSVPGQSKYFFLTSKSNFLGETPLEALVSGRLAQVLGLAKAFRGG
jgi:hypothetical protein